jgi:hypothetical protein
LFATSSTIFPSQGAVSISTKRPDLLEELQYLVAALLQFARHPEDRRRARSVALYLDLPNTLPDLLLLGCLVASPEHPDQASHLE